MSKSVDHLPTSPNISTWATRHGELVPRSYGCQWRTFRGKSALFGLGFGTLFQAWKRFPDLRTGLDLNGLLENIRVGKPLWKILLFFTLWLFPVNSSMCPIQSFVRWFAYLLRCPSHTPNRSFKVELAILIHIIFHNIFQQLPYAGSDYTTCSRHIKPSPRQAESCLPRRAGCPGSSLTKVTSLPSRHWNGKMSTQSIVIRSIQFFEKCRQ